MQVHLRRPRRVPTSPIGRTGTLDPSRHAQRRRAARAVLALPAALAAAVLAAGLTGGVAAAVPTAGSSGSSASSAETPPQQVPDSEAYGEDQRLSSGDVAHDAAASKDDGVTHATDDTMGATIPAHEDGAAGGAADAVTPKASGIRGNDVSHYQGSISWSKVYGAGGRFSYAKATEGTTFRDPKFADNYVGAYKAGVKHGAYHFALPDKSSGATQAKYFAAHGGAWSKDHKTLPGALDIEYNPYGSTCYGLSDSAMRSWIDDFSDEYHAQTGRWPVIYSTYDWWSNCTGNTSAFASHSPLWIARYSSSVGTLPSGWSTYTFWQYDDSGSLPGDQDTFNGASDRLTALCDG